MSGLSSISNIVGKPKNKRELITADQRTSDIINLMLKNHHANLPAAKKVASKFDGGSVYATGQNIFDFLKKNIQYKIEPPHYQTTKTIQRFMADGHGDCKHLSNFTGTILHALGIPFAYRFVSFKAGSKEPTHVYTVAFDGAKEIPIDAVLPFYNTEKPYTHKIDKKMSLYQLSGVDSLGDTDTLFYVGSVDGDDLYLNGANVLHVANNSNNPQDMVFMPVAKNPIKQLTSIGSTENYLGSIGDADFYAIGDTIGRARNRGRVVKKVRGAVKSAVKKAGKPAKIVAKKVKQAAKKTGKAVKKVGKKVVKVVKKGALVVPRQAFRALVALNVRGWATGIQKANAKDSGAVRRQWEKVGGNYGDLMAAFNAGARKKRIMGIDEYNSLAGIGATTVAASLTAALPVIAIMVPLIKRLGGSEDGQGGNYTSNEEIANAAASIATEVATQVSERNDNRGGGLQRGSDAMSEERSDLSNDVIQPAAQNNTTKYLLIGGAALAAFLIFKK